MSEQTAGIEKVIESIPEEVTYSVVDSFATQLAEAEKSLKVKDQASYEKGVAMGQAFKRFEIANAEHHDPMIKAAHAAHKETTKAKNRFGDVISAALKSLREKVGGYVQAKEEETRKEQLRIDAEQKKREDAAALKEAERLEKAGADKEAVDRALDSPPPAPPPPPVAAPRVEQMAGTSTRKNWKMKVIDPMKLIKAVASGEANKAFVIPDEKALNKLAKALEANFDVPGCKAYNDAGASFSK